MKDKPVSIFLINGETQHTVESRFKSLVLPLRDKKQYAS